MNLLIDDVDRDAIAHTYGRTLHDGAQFDAIVAAFDEGVDAAVSEVTRWRAVATELLGGPRAFPALENPEKLEIMRLIASGLDGPSSLDEWSEDYQIEMSRCADILIGAGLALRSTIVSEIDDMIGSEMVAAAATESVRLEGLTDALNIVRQYAAAME